MKLITPLLFFFSFISCSNNSDNKNEPGEPVLKKSVVVKKIFLTRPFYKLEYPYRWKIDSTDQDYDIDSYFSLDSPSGGCSVIFMFFNTNIDEKEHLNEQIKEHLKVTIKNGVVSYFDRWGNYKGEGATIKGKLLGVFKGELKIFIHSNDTTSFLILSQLQDQDKVQDEDGLKLIETSFRTK